MNAIESAVQTELKAAAPTLADAQLALKNAALAMGLPPQSAAMSAYINGLLQSARITALCKYLIESDPDADAKLSAITVEVILNDIVPKLTPAPTILHAAAGRQ